MRPPFDKRLRSLDALAPRPGFVLVFFMAFPYSGYWLSMWTRFFYRLSECLGRQILAEVGVGLACGWRHLHFRAWTPPPLKKSQRFGHAPERWA